MASMKFRWHLVCLMALMFMSDAIADADATPVASKWHLAIDYAASVHYHEPGMSENGTLDGIYLDWDTSPARPWTIVGNLTGLLGDLKYRGATQDGTPLFNINGDHVWSGELALGRHLGAANNVTLYAGVGTRYWTDVITNTTTVSGGPALGYRREITYLYAPVGARVGESLGGRWRLEVDAKYMSLLEGKVRSHLEDIDPNFQMLKNGQHTGHGYAVSLRFAHLMVNNPTFTESFIEPYFQAWSVSQSGNSTIFYAGVPVGYGYEPNNTTRIIGVRFGVTF